MLRELQIKNFAIIDDLTIRFDSGLTILSGETGAGKSIIINAVNLLLGSRASAKLIRAGEKSAELSALFDIPGRSSAAAIMSENGYEPKDGLLVRRVIMNNDRHRVYINDRMATMQMLAAITADLASISSQHAHQRLLKEETHLAILDHFGGLLPLVNQVSDLFGKLVPLTQKLQALKQKKSNQEKEMELLRFQAAEITDAGIIPGEDESLEQERLRLKHAESLNQSALTAIDFLYRADGAILERLGVIHKDIQKAADLDDALHPILKDLANHMFGLEDVTEKLQSYQRSLDTDRGSLDSVEARLDLISKLKRKYGGSLAAIFAQQDAIIAELTTIENLDDDIHQGEEKLGALYEELAERARQLSKKRKQVAKIFSDSVEAELADLKMPGTRFSVDFPASTDTKQKSEWFYVDGQSISAAGIDQAVFMIAPNLGEALKPLAAIASGGELSRVVLALKAILAETDAVGTVIFDEVDAGIGGAVADVVGKKLMGLSGKHQLICITHLPQIARFGKHHYYIEKQVRNGRTITDIRPMDQEERVNEIARMLGGETISQTAIEHARALMK